MKRALLRIESCLTVPIFIGSWLICAIGFAAMAGFQMAKAEGAKKGAVLDQFLKSQKP